MFALGWGGAFLYYKTWADSEASKISIIRENPSEYEFINPMLLIENSQIEFQEYEPLKEKLEDYTKKSIDSGQAKNVSVYFRDLNTAKWTGVNEDDKYAPSSILKVVTLIAYLSIAQEDPDILGEKVYFQSKSDPGQYYKPATSRPAGYYTIRDLLIYMISESDNASMTLLNELRPGKFLEVYGELGLPKPLSSTDDFMSAATYSRLLRSLYSSTYLARPYSEEALKLLSETTFNKGLTANIPSTITVSHKFGEHTALDRNGVAIEHELHDCGIVYYPAKPYLLCVMTKGQNFSELERIISEISTLVYHEVENDS
jgi:beta-lactamase class A